MSGSIVKGESGHPQGNLMVPGLLGATGEVPPPPAPYYDPDFETNFPSELGCGHPFRMILNNCDECQVCNTVYAALKSNRERASFRNSPQTRPSSVDRAGYRETRVGTIPGGKGAEKRRPISSRKDACEQPGRRPYVLEGTRPDDSRRQVSRLL